MMRKRRTVAAGIMVIVLCCLCGCGSKPSSGPEGVSSDIAIDAQGTFLEFQNAVDEGKESQSTEIPSKYWKKGINALEPIRVYMHRANMVVVQRSEDGVEEGQYIYIPVSSYLPQSGDDGFEFDAYPNHGDQDDPYNSVFHFKRKIMKKP